jgi:hypothetical protein
MGGLQWDVSWHRSIGRDTATTPAHIAIYISGLLAGVYCGYLILAPTFSREHPLRDVSVKVLGFRGPFGAFAGAWGGLALLTSVPFDGWWHLAYGLDVKILSPPHILFGMGILALELGTLFLIAAARNRASGTLRNVLDALYLYASAMVLLIMVTVLSEYLSRVYMHSAVFYLAVAIAAAPVLAACSLASGNKWAASIIAGLYTLFVCCFTWLLPLFPATPRLGPILHPITHFVASEFPLLLVAPALAIDLLRQRSQNPRGWRNALACGLSFQCVLLAVQWPFASFLMSSSSRNAFFATASFGYDVPPSSDFLLSRFTVFEKTPAQFALILAAAFAATVVLFYGGSQWGAWMRRIKR